MVSKKKMRRRAKILETEGMAVFVYQLMNLSGAEYKECRKIFDVPPRFKTHDLDHVMVFGRPRSL